MKKHKLAMKNQKLAMKKQKLAMKKQKLAMKKQKKTKITPLCQKKIHIRLTLGTLVQKIGT